MNCGVCSRNSCNQVSRGTSSTSAIRCATVSGSLSAWAEGAGNGAVKLNEREAYGEGLNTGTVLSSLVSIVSGLAGVADGASPDEDATAVASVDAVDWVGGRAALRAAADFGGIGGRDVPIGSPMTSAPCSVLARARLRAGASIGVSGVGLGLTSPVCTGEGVCMSLRAAVGAGGEGVCGVAAGGSEA